MGCLSCGEEPFPFGSWEKRNSLCMFTGSLLCSLRREDRDLLINQGGEKIKMEINRQGELQRPVCICVCAQPARGMTLMQLQSKVIA